MDSPRITYRYYSNPAFCAQSEVVFTQQTPCVSPRIVASGIPERPRMSPLGSNSPRKPQSFEIARNNYRTKTDISDNPLRITNGGPLRYVKDEPPELPPKPAKFTHSRTNSASSTLQRQRSIIKTKRSNSTRSRSHSEDLEMSSMRSYQEAKIIDDKENSITNHRYEVIKDMDDIDYSPTKKRIIESETDEYNVDGPDDNEFKAIPTEIIKTVNGNTHRYAIIPSDDDEPPKRHNVTFSPPPMSEKHLIATQKLHELLSTPRKQTMKSYASQPSVRMTNSELRMVKSPQVIVTPSARITSTPKQGITSSKSCANLTVSPKNLTSSQSPRAQQKLNYGLPDFERSRQQTFSPDFISRGYRQRSFDRTLERAPRSPDRLNRSLDLDRRSPEWERRENRSLELEKHGREVGKSRFFDREARSPKRAERTAIITPRLAVQHSPSVYSEESTYKSWGSGKSNTATYSLAIAAHMMTLCGGLTAGLSFYMMYAMGRHYYLDFTVLSGFTCLLLGLLGFRTRTRQLLPNRNYISGLPTCGMYSHLHLFDSMGSFKHNVNVYLAGRHGIRGLRKFPNARGYSGYISALHISIVYYASFCGYILLSTFSLLSGAGLLTLLVLTPSPGTALNDVTSGAVCGLSVLSLCVASWGVLASYCCETPPPDNRVGHV